MSLVKHLPELGYSVVAVAHSHRVEYTLYQIASHQQGSDGQYTVPRWPVRGSVTSGDDTDVLADAEVYLHGAVKWDGCSDWHFDEQDRVMLHGCDRDALLNIGKVMAWCWDCTAELCPSWDGTP